MATPHLAVLRDTEPERMTARAKAYLLIAGFRHALMGVWCISFPGAFVSTSFSGIKHVMPLWLWGATYLCTATVCVVAVATRKEPVARWALIMSATITGLWTGGFLAAYFAGQLTGPVGIIAFLCLTLKDLVQCRAPLSTPFEPIVRAVLRERIGRSTTGRGTARWPDGQHRN